MHGSGDKLLYSPSEAASALGISLRSVQYLIKTGALKSTRVIGARGSRIDARELLKFRDRCFETER
jgi:excisionase family DNA binding protein